MNKEAKTYLIITFLITYISWGYIALYTQLRILPFNQVPYLYVFYIIGVISPMISGFIVKIKYQRKDFKAFLFSIFIPKKIIFTTVYIILIGFLIRVVPNYLESKSLSFSQSILLQIPLFILFGGLEEVGWRGILVPIWSKELSLMKTFLWIGVIWTLWHTPLFFILGTYQNLQMDILGFFLNTMTVSVLLGILYTHTQSIFACILCHAFLNALANFYLVSNSLLISFITFLLSVILLVIYQKKGYDPNRNETRKHLITD